MKRVLPGPGQESVWDYPRPPRLEATRRHVVVRFDGVLLADSRNALRLLETSHPPTYYIPPADVRMDLLTKIARTSFCEWKGTAHYFDLVHRTKRAAAVAWGYADPTPAFAALRDHVALYAAPMDECTVDDERVIPQPGGFYGGWITRDLVGPFKGEPGSYGW